MNNLFNKALEWYMKGGVYRVAVCELFPEKKLENEIDEYEKVRKENMVKDRDKMLQEMLVRCKKLFPVGSLIQSDDGTDCLPNLIISEPRIQKVEYLPWCVNNSWEYDGYEKKTIVVDTIRIWRNEPCWKSKVCLEQLLYYMDKPDGSDFKKNGFINLKEYEKEQLEKKDEESKRLKGLIERLQRDLDESKKKLVELKAYNPSELTEQKLEEILKNVTKNN